MSKSVDIRYVFGQPRSGTSAFQRALCQVSGLKGVYEPLRYELHWGDKRLKGKVFYSKDHKDCHPLLKKNPDETFILKDILGHFLLNKIDQVFTDEIVKRSAPVFLFRDPIDATNSLKKVNWYPVPYFVESYERGYMLYDRLKKKGLPVSTLTHDELTSDKSQDILNYIVSSWGFSPKNNTASWSDSYFNHVFYEKEQKQEITNSGSHGSLISSKGLSNNFNNKANLLLTKEEVALVERKLRPLYKDIKSQSITLKI
jgi:hypothetical protein